MEDIVFSRRQGLKALGVAAGAAFIGTGLAKAATAAPRLLQGAPEAPNNYSLTITNDSKLDGYQALIYQQLPKMQPGVVTLAWQAFPCNPGDVVDFGWEIQYSFIWSRNGTLKPGTRVSASGSVDAELGKANATTLSFKNNGYRFSEPVFQEGNGLYVFEDRSVPKAGDPTSGSVGIGMSGFGTFACPTSSNTNIGFTPTPQYWIAFGTYDKTEVMDIQQLTVPQQVKFGEGQDHLDCRYDGRDWTIS
ncbi:hypothetical protein [Lentzea kentuckyensis]|uniref:hypothetical protein n=1 Tax=Lentzea kentuckyensis TaxID=360086 RepID=UPI000A3C950D|nr:hypothetical protein [Lentzea kentuckyensis]